MKKRTEKEEVMEKGTFGQEQIDQIAPGMPRKCMTCHKAGKPDCVACASYEAFKRWRVRNAYTLGHVGGRGLEC